MGGPEDGRLLGRVPEHAARLFVSTSPHMDARGRSLPAVTSFAVAGSNELPHSDASAVYVRTDRTSAQGHAVYDYMPLVSRG